MTLFTSLWRNITAVLVFALLATTGALAQDASIDRLLNKLPPPAKLVKPPVQRAIEQPDPAFKDPIRKQIFQAVVTDNFPASALPESQTYPALSTECRRAVSARRAGVDHAPIRRSVILLSCRNEYSTAICARVLRPGRSRRRARPFRSRNPTSSAGC